MNIETNFLGDSRPTTPVEHPVAGTTPTVLVDPMQAQMQFLQGLVQQQGVLIGSLSAQMNVLVHQGSSTHTRVPKLPLPKTYNGTAENFDGFWLDIHAYLEEKAAEFVKDSSKITLVSSLLTDSARTWADALRLKKLQKFHVPELESFEIFMESFRDHFMSRTRRVIIQEKLDKFTRSKGTPMSEHLAELESLVIQSGLIMDSAEGSKYLFKSLDPETRLVLRNAMLVKPDLGTSYAETKLFLNQLDANYILASMEKKGMLPVSVPVFRGDPMAMDLSQVEFELDTSLVESPAGYVTVATVSSTGTIKWQQMPKEDWIKLRDCLLSVKCCPFCRDMVASGHQPGSVCKKKDFNFSALCKHLKINEESLHYAISFFSTLSLVACPSPNSFVLPIKLGSTGKMSTIKTLMDTGAQGTDYISVNLVKQLGLQLESTTPILIKHFQGKGIEVSAEKTKKLTLNIRGKKYFTSLIVMRDLPQGIILGFDFFAENDLLLDCKRKRLVPHQDMQPAPPNSSPSPTKVPEKISVSSCSFSEIKKSKRAYSSWVPFKTSTLSAIEAGTDNTSLDNLPEYLKKFRDVFDLKKLDNLPAYNEEFAMPIDIKANSSLPQATPYKLSIKEEEALREALDKGLAAGKYEISKSAGGCPVLFVKNRDGGLRMCIDYRRLNSITESIQAFLPDIHDLIVSIPRVPNPRYSKFDLKSAFPQLRVRKGDEWKTAFVTKYGKFQSKVIPFGCKNAPAWFQSIMQKLFGHLINRGMCIYLDDILVYEPDPKKHRLLVLEIMEILRKNNLILNLKKCIFEAESVDFLGYKLSAKGILMQEDKLLAIKSFVTPTSVKQIQRFLGLCNYYRDFIPQFSRVAVPLFTLLKKDTKFTWTQECELSFTTLKDSFHEKDFLMIPDRTKPFTLYTDCSKQALGAALHQLDQDGHERPVSFYSRTLTSAEQNYPIYDKELLAVKAALEHWRYLLIYTEDPVVIHCDHKNLLYFKKPQLLNERQARWHEFLADYNIDLKYLPGHLNVVADALSRAANSDADTKKVAVLSSVTKSVSFSTFDTLSPTDNLPTPRKLVYYTYDNEYYTPSNVVQLAKQVAHVESFDLDPASSHVANSHNNIAQHYFCKKQDGLKQEWYGDVFINPPYSSSSGNTSLWINKALECYQTGKISSITMLLRDASGTKYFDTASKNFAACYLKDRLRFWTPDGVCPRLSRDKHVLVYLGPHIGDFKDILAEYGLVTLPSTHVNVAPILQAPSQEFEPTQEELSRSSADDLFELSTFKPQFEDSSEFTALEDPTLTTLQNWPVFLFYPLTGRTVPEDLPEKFQRLVKMNIKYTLLRDNRLYRKIEYLDHLYEVPYIPEVSRNDKLKEIHDTLGHLSNDSVFDSLRTRCWWPLMLKDLRDFQESCQVCQLHRRSNAAATVKVAIPPTGLPFYRWGVDFIQDLPETDLGNKNIIVAVDHATRYVVAMATTDRTSKTVASFLFKLMVKFGAPHEIITDRASCFQSVLADYLHMQKIHHFPSTPYHPNTNGMVERVNGTLGALLTKMTLGTREKWDRFVPSATFILNIRKHAVTGYSPFFLVHGFNPRLPGDVYPPNVYSNSSEDVSLRTSGELIRLGQHRYEALKKSQENARKYVESQDSDTEARTFVVGEFVKLKHFTKLKLEFTWRGPFIVDSIGPHNTYYLKKPDGTLLSSPYNGIHLAPFKGGDLSEPDPTTPEPGSGD